MSAPRDPLLQQARDRLQRAIAQHRQVTQRSQSETNERLRQALQPELDQLTALLQKLDEGLVRIAIFGLVSRGKSAVLNALVGQKLLETGPINGLTREPQTVRWRLGDRLQVDLVDTPGLDEIDGQTRAVMAQREAEAADLIMFVLAGDMTRRELQAIRKLWQFHKPLLLVFNKTDLYPAPDRRAIAANLQQYLTVDATDPQPIALNNVVAVAAEPAPLRVRTEWPNGEVNETWETPPPDIDALRDRLLALLQTEGAALLTLNALVQTREAEAAIARKTLAIRQDEAEALIWTYARNKGIAIAANPVVLLDLLGGAIADLALIRALARLYGLPMTSHEAGALLRKILISSGTLLLADLGGGLFLGAGKSAAALGSLDNPSGWVAYGGAAIAQGSLAGYGSYLVGRAAQIYLEQGCTWGETGASTLIRGILAQVDRQSVLYRLRLELEQSLPLF